MLKMSSSSLLYKFIVLSIIALIILSILGITFILPLLTSSTVSPGYAFSLKYIFMALLALNLLVIIILTLSWFRYFSQMEAEKQYCLDQISSMQNELEKQNKLVANLTNMYNNIVEYDNFKTEFFSNISHELKTPLTVILGAIQLMNQKHSGIPQDRRNSGKHLHTIKQNCYRLLRLVNNVLDISRLDSGYIKLNKVNVNIVYLIEEITQSVIPYAEQKGLSLEFDTEYEEIITGVDIDKVERIVLNLLSNAIKFTPSGGKIWVNISYRNKKVFFSVKDTGLGIPENKFNIIFERFRHANTSLTREYEGSGIGLSLVKSFVELHNGTINVSSEENQGSEFVIELPVNVCESSRDNDCTSQNLQSRIVETLNIEFSDIYSAAS